MRYFMVCKRKYKILPPSDPLLQGMRCLYCEHEYDTRDKRRVCIDVCGHEKCMACAFKAPTICDECDSARLGRSNEETREGTVGMEEEEEDDESVWNKGLVVNCLLVGDGNGEEEFPEIGSVTMEMGKVLVVEGGEVVAEEDLVAEDAFDDDEYEDVTVVDLCEDDKLEPELVDLTEEYEDSGTEEMNVSPMERDGRLEGPAENLRKRNVSVQGGNGHPYGVGVDERRQEAAEANDIDRNSSNGSRSLSVSDDGYGTMSPPPPCSTSKTAKCLRKRKRSKTVQKIIHCRYCKETFSERKHLGEHMTAKHSERRPFPCDVCRWPFDSIRNLETHRLIHTNSRPYTCPHCDNRFTRKYCLQKHLENVHSYKTPIKITSGVLKLQRGRVNDTGRVNVLSKSVNLFVRRKSYAQRRIRYPVAPSVQPVFSCSLCEKTFPKKKHLGKHLLEKHSDERPFACKICGWSFAFQNKLKLHMLTHSMEKPHKCDQCESSFNRKYSLQRHIRVMHLKAPRDSERPEHRPCQRKAAVCPYCLLELNNRQLLSAHMKDNHSDKRPFVCDQCQWPFAWRKHLNAHMKTHSTEKPFACAICEGKFNRRFSLERHMDNVHKIIYRLNQEDTVQEEYCEECQTQFNKEKNLKVAYSECGHIACLECVARLELGCGQCATGGTVNKSHESVPGKRKRGDDDGTIPIPETQAGSISKGTERKRARRSYECRHCKERFSRKIDIGPHMAEKHSEGRPYVCTVCSWPFINKRDMVRHQVIHANVKPFSCNYCEMRFTRKSSLDRHFESLHSGKRETVRA